MQIDTTRFNEVMDDLRAALHGAGQYSDAANIVRDEGVRLVRQIIRFLPPQTRQQGERAIERELTNFISEAELGLLRRVTRRYGPGPIDGWWNIPSRGQVHLQWDAVDMSPTGERVRPAHYAAKNARGKVPLRKVTFDPAVWRSRLVAVRGVRDRYIRAVQQHVGRLKASWAQLAIQMGLRVEPWVARHVPSPYGILDTSGLTDGQFPRLMVGSRAPGVSEPSLRRHYEDAIRVRTEAMQRRLRLVLSGYNQALARQMKIAARRKAEEYDLAHPENEYGTSGVGYGRV